MFENIIKFFKNISKKEKNKASNSNSKDTAKERLHLVLMQDRANVSADFLELMKQEIIDVIKKYIDVDESAIDVRLTNKENDDGTNGAPALYANIPIINIKNDARKNENKEDKKEEVKEKVEEVEEIKDNKNEEIGKDKEEEEKDKENKEEVSEKSEEEVKEEDAEIIIDDNEQEEKENQEKNKVESKE